MAKTKKRGPTGDKKKYRNTGVSELIFKDDEGEDLVCEPGSEFEVFLTPEHEQQLLAGEHIEIVKDQSRQADLKQAAEAGEAPASTVKKSTK